MNYESAREYISNISKKGNVLGLESIENLMNRLGNVQEQLKVVHIAGTNGKGSTLAYLQSVLSLAGYKTGRYNSPAVFDILEVFTIDGQNITREDYAKYVTLVAEKCQEMEREGYPHPTYFEMETAMAYTYFYDKKCDVVLIETGMGGDTDATNVVKHTLLSILAPVSMDHMQFLGNTLEEIAAHKAGIIKHRSTVVTGLQEPEVYTVIKKKARDMAADYCEMGTPDNIQIDETNITFDYKNYQALKIRMKGTFQTYNAALCVEAVTILREKGFHISDEELYKGLWNTVWHGRFEKLSDRPLIIFDGGHNPGAAKNLRESIQIYFTNKKIVYIIGVLADKDYNQVLRLTADLAEYIITITPRNNVRALDGRKLLETVKQYNEHASYAASIEEAIKQATDIAGDEGGIMIFGSLSYLSDMKQAVMTELHSAE